MERKLNKIVKWFTKERLEVLMGFICLVTLLGMEVMGIVLAILEHNYLILAIVTYIWIVFIVQCYIKKMYIKNLVEKLIQIPYTSNLLFFITGIIAIILSWKYFIAFIFCMVHSFVYGEYSKLKEERRVR